MIEQAEAFFERYAADAALREQLRQAEECYPGSLEIREAVVEDVLLPAAHALGYNFTLEELRTYETRVKLRNARPDLPIPEDEEIDDDPHRFWLLDHGWTYDTDVYPDKLPGTEE
ncbi:MAG: Nif11-like leader peptide family natural product precursor [Eubacteriales bacterium]|nr:Nif11-like leader peptide family natural product precursor [Eubacteriales bacterium]